MASDESPPLDAIVIGAIYAFAIAFLVNQKAWPAAAGVFVYGLALGMGYIYQAAKGGRL